MESVIKKTYEACLSEILALSMHSHIFSALCKKTKGWLSSLRDFIVCHSFFEGERTRRS